MELFKLFAKLVLDSSEFKSGVADAQKEAEDLSESIEDASGSFDDLADSMVDTGDAAEDSSESQRDFGESVKDSTQQSEKGGSALDRYSAILNKVKSAAAAMVAVKIAKWLWDTTAAVAEYGDHIDKASQKMGLSAKSYQEWAFIAEHSGTSIDGLTTSMRTLANQSATNRDAFEKLGMSFEDVQKMSQEELFENTIRALQNVEDETERTRIASKLLGRGAMELGALFNGTGEDIDGMKTRIAELGGVMSDTLVKKSAAYEDAMTDLQAAVQGAKNNISEFFMEFNTSVITAAANALGYLNQSFRELFQMDVTPEEKLEKMKTALESLRTTYETFKDTDPIGAAEIQNQIDSYIVKIEALEGELAAASDTTATSVDEQKAKLAELQAAYAEVYQGISDSMEGWFGAFDNASYEVTTSFDEMIENVQSQLAFWQEYEANLKTLADAGFGDLVDAIGEMGPAGAEYAQVLAGMATAGEDGTTKLQELQDAMTQVDDARAKAAETVTEIQFKDNSDESLKNIDSVKRAMENLDGTTSTVYIETVETGGSGYRRHAGGLDYVPFHDYPALLHEGERVLTKQENKAYSEGRTGSYRQQPIQVNVNAPVMMDGAMVARQQYSFLLNLDDAHGMSLIKA